jgi:NADPH-dependent 2,4-dienoyl-CoA reductase/sulfur reductase-like enzyme
MRTVAIVGGSLAGLSTARALRNQGFNGRLTIVGAEAHRPYDRPPLSKSFLAGNISQAELALEADEEDLDAEWRLGVTATGLNAGEHRLDLSDGTTLSADGIVLATGASPRMLAGAPALAGVHVLRTLEDAHALQADLRQGGRLVVVGAGFIGAEVASTARGMGLDVTVVEAAASPLAGPLGAEMGAVVSGLHTAHGVRLRCGVGVTGLTGAERVTGIALADGSVVPADVVLIGIGVQPNTQWLAGTALDISDGVVCDAWGGTGVDSIVAVGDCASWHEPRLGRPQRLEHWTGARERAAIAAATLLSQGADRRSGRPPYFWSDQYGLTIQFAGHISGFDDVTVEEGNIGERDFLAVYQRHGAPTAVLAMGHAKSFMRWRRQLAAEDSKRAARMPATAAGRGE